MNGEVKKVRDTTKVALDEARIALGLKPNEQISEAVERKLDGLPGDFDLIENAMSVVRLRCEGIANVDESVLEQYRKYQREITEKNKELAQLEAEAKTVNDEIKRVQSVWVNALKSLIRKIDKNFGEYMANMNYSGEVYLYEGEKEVCVKKEPLFVFN